MLRVACCVAPKNGTRYTLHEFSLKHLKHTHMISFEFSQDVVQKVLEKLSSAKKYIRIAIFQIYRKKFTL